MFLFHNHPHDTASYTFSTPPLTPSPSRKKLSTSSLYFHVFQICELETCFLLERQWQREIQRDRSFFLYWFTALKCSQRLGLWAGDSFQPSHTDTGTQTLEPWCSVFPRQASGGNWNKEQGQNSNSGLRYRTQATQPLANLLDQPPVFFLNIYILCSLWQPLI